MKLHQLVLHNFGPFVGSVTVPLGDQGVVFVLGENLVDPGFDGNAVGKSSILDGLLWGLYGDVGPQAEAVSADDIVNDAVGKGCRVEVMFTGVDQYAYRVVRWRRHTKASDPTISPEKPNGVVLEVADEDTVWKAVENVDVNNVQAAIDRKLGLDYALACRVMVMSQDDAFSFVQATPAMRHALLTEIEGYQELDAWAASFGKRHIEAMGQRAEVAAKAEAARTPLAYLERSDPKIAWDAFERERFERCEAARKRLAAAEERGQRLREHAAGVPALEAELAAVLVAEDAANKNARMPKPADLVAWEQRLSELNASLKVVRSRIDDVNRRERAIQTEVGTCDRCGAHVSPTSIAQHRAHFDGERAALRLDEQRVVEAIQQAEPVVAEGARNYSALVNGAMETARAAAGRSRELSVRVRDAKQAALDLATVGREQREAIIEAEKWRSAANPHQAALLNHEAEIAEARAKLVEHNGALDRLDTELGLLSWWMRAVPSIKAWLFDAACADITREANRWLTIFSQGTLRIVVEAVTTTKAGELRDKVSLRRFRRLPDGTEVERKKWSGGEKRRIVLSLVWAISARLARRAKTNVSFIALDEVDRGLDDAGKRGLLAALDVLAQEKSTALVVSHHPAFKALTGKRWIVRKTSKGSTVEVT